jgi:hypothetical protein
LQQSPGHLPTSVLQQRHLAIGSSLMVAVTSWNSLKIHAAFQEYNVKFQEMSEVNCTTC